MAKKPDQDKPIDIADSANVDTDAPIQTPEQTKLAQRVQELFKGSFNAKLQLDLPDQWAMYDDYKHNRQNNPINDEDPGSVTNIIHPIIESQISDLVDKPYSVEAKGTEPSDDLYAEQVKHMLEWVLYKNKFITKLNLAEHDRLELGTCIIKVFTDPDALDGKGLPTFEIISPANFFPDPKVQYAHLLQEAEFMIHAVWRPLSWIRKKFPKTGKFVQRQVSVPYDPNEFDGQTADEASYATSQKALMIECYLQDEDGSIYCVQVANYIILEDSRDVIKGKLQHCDKFPFVAIPCYVQRGKLWGQGDVELLIPTQDIINELDDQIRMAARLMGNPQMVIGMGAGKGFDYRKWTNKAGLRIPMRDANSWKPVPAEGVSQDIPNRREQAFIEADKISGRPDVNRGSAPGAGVTAATAIIALQQAGQKSTDHKAQMFRDGWADVLDLLLDEIKENWTDEMWVRIEGDVPDYKFYNPQALNNVPIMIPDATAGPEDDSIKPLMDETTDKKGNVTSSKPMTREAQFDLKISMGNGLPNDKSFIYQTMQALAPMQIGGVPVMSLKEFRDYLRTEVGIPLQDDSQMQMQQPPQQPMMPGQTPMNGIQPGQPMQGQQPPTNQPAPLNGVPPQMLQMQTGGVGNV